jgi:xylulokinase
MGVGAIEAGRCVLSMGTVASIGAVLRADSDGGMVPTGPHVMPERRLAIGAAQSAGAALRWYRDLLTTDGSGEHATTTFEELVNEVEDRPSTVMFVPHLAGSRFAFGDASLSGTLTGLTLATDRPDLTRAVLEGVALELSVVCERFEAGGIEISALTAAGGGTRSDMWVQIIADVIGRPIASTGSGDAGALGAALLAGVGSSAFASFGAAAAAGLVVHDDVEPREANAAWWTQRRADYKALVVALSDVASRQPRRDLLPD